MGIKSASILNRYVDRRKRVIVMGTAVIISRGTTHVSTLWTVILGSEEWKERVKVRREAVDRGKEERVAVLRTCRAAVKDIGVW